MRGQPRFQRPAQLAPRGIAASVTSCQDGVRGLMRALALNYGSSFDAERLAFDSGGRTVRYRTADEAPLPMATCVSSVEALATSRGSCSIMLCGRSCANSARDDAFKVIDGAYRAGLGNLKKAAESVGNALRGKRCATPPSAIPI